MTTFRSREANLTTAVRRGAWGSGWTLAALAAPSLAFGAPTGGQVVAGSAAIAQAGTKTTIFQSTAKGAINWQGFSIGTNEYVQFVQPGSTSVTLNRVVGNDPSQLLGQMSANGQIFLVNPSGVYFGANARIDVAGLVATTFDIADDDFMAGRYQFARVEGRDPAQVINDGTITANGGYVVLAGDGVQNHGLIEAYLGDIVMAAGERVGLDLGGDGLISFSVDGEALTEIAGVENTGDLYADGGRVFLTAKVQGDLLPTAVNHEGLIQARTVEERDGVIYLGGTGGDVTVVGTLDTSADEPNADGGTILVASTNDITVSDGALITAQGDGSGNGGVVRLIASEVLDIEANTTVTTEGGETGQGGFVEISGHQGVNVRGDVTPGSGGNLLIDPAQIFIKGGAGVTSCASFCSEASFDSGTTTIYEETIETHLDNGTDVTLVATSSIRSNVSGSFDNGAIDATGSGDLTLAIGTVSFSSPGELLYDVLGEPVGCGTAGVCTPSFGGTGSPSPFFFTPGLGRVNLTQPNGDPLDITIGGDFAIRAGNGGNFFDNVSVGSIQAASVLIEGRLIRNVSNPLTEAISIVATSGSVNLHELVITNNLGGASIDIQGNGVTVNPKLIAWASGSLSSADATIRIDGGSGRVNIVDFVAAQTNTGNALVEVIGNGVSIRSAFVTALSTVASADATLHIDGGTGPANVAVSSAVARTNFGNADIQITGSDVWLRNVNAYAGNGGDASININASGTFNWSVGGFIAAFDFTPFGACTTSACPKFTPTTGLDSLGSLVPGLEFPTYPLNSGNAFITIRGAAVNLNLPFTETGFLGAEGWIGAAAGQFAKVDIAATNGNLLVGGVSNAPLIFSQSGLAGTSGADFQLSVTNGTMTVNKTPTPLIDDSIARNVTLLSIAEGDNNARLRLFGGNIAIRPGATIAALIDRTGSTLGGSRSAFVDIAGDLVTVDGNIGAIASNGGVARVGIEGSSGDLVINGLVQTLGSISSVDLSAVGDISIGSTGAVDTQLVKANASNGAVILQNFTAFQISGAAANGFQALTSGDLRLGSIDANSIEVVTNGRLNVDGQLNSTGVSSSIALTGSLITTSAPITALGPVILTGTSGAFINDIINGDLIQIFTDDQITLNGQLLSSGFNGDLGLFAKTGITINAGVSGTDDIFIDGGGGGVVVNAIVEAKGSGNSTLITVNGDGGLTVGNTGQLLASNSGSSGAEIRLGLLSSMSSIQNNGVIQANTTAGSAVARVEAIATGALVNNGFIIADSAVTPVEGPTAIVDLTANSLSGTGGVISQYLQINTSNGAIQSTRVDQLSIQNSTGNVVVDNLSASLLRLNQFNIGSGSFQLTHAGDLEHTAGFSTAGTVNVSATGSVWIFDGGIDALNSIMMEAGDVLFVDGATLQASNGSLTSVELTSLSSDVEFSNAFVYSADGDLVVRAGGDVLIGGNGSVPSTQIWSGFEQGVMEIKAGGSVLGTFADTVNARAMTIEAGDRIDLTGVGLVTVLDGQARQALGGAPIGDPNMLQQLAALGGFVPTSSVPNGAFIAPNEVRLGNVDFFGDYLYLRSDQLTLDSGIGTWLPGTFSSPVLNPNVIVQMVPFTNGRAISVEDLPPSSQLTGVTYYTNAGHFQKFPGTSLFVGGTGFGGAITIGQGGSLNIGGQNFLAATTGGVSGIGSIVSTGIVGIAGTAIPPSTSPTTPPTTPPTEPVNTGVVNTVVQQTTTPTDPTGSSIPEETVEANVPTDEQTETDTTPEGPVDVIAMLEQQPLIDGQVEVNNTVLTCQ